MIIVALYIVIPARHAREQRTGKTGPQVELVDYVGPAQETGQQKSLLKGTGGTELMRFLKSRRKVEYQGGYRALSLFNLSSLTFQILLFRCDMRSPRILIVALGLYTVCSGEVVSCGRGSTWALTSTSDMLRT